MTVEIAPSGETSFYRSVIRSDERFTYGQVQRILEGKEQHELADVVRLADSVSADLRRRRFARGALRVESPEVNFAFDGKGGVERAWLEAEPQAHALIEELMILANEAVAEFLASRKAGRALPRPRAARAAVGRAAARQADRPRGADAAGARRREHGPGRGGTGRGGGERARRRLRAKRGAWAGGVPRARPARAEAGALRPAATSATPVSRAPRTRTSPRRSGATPTSSSTGRSCASSARATTLVPRISSAVAEHTSETERAATEIEYRADEICAAWLLERTLFDRGWEEPFAGEVTGVIPSGLFVRFGEVFEGFLPARRLHGDYYELNELGTALVGRRGGRRYRLGDEIDVKVEDIRRAGGQGRVSTPESGGARGGGRRGRPSRRRSGPRAR